MTSKRIILTDEFKGQEKEEGEAEKKKNRHLARKLSLVNFRVVLHLGSCFCLYL